MIITLTTDFGQRDSFVGAMKGVILGIAPAVEIVDLAHGLAAGDIRGGAFALMTAMPYLSCRHDPHCRCRSRRRKRAKSHRNSLAARDLAWA